MLSDTFQVCVVLLCLIPGVLCKYDYNVGGLVASVLFAFFMLTLIVIMLVVIVMWRDWYERKQIMKGIQKKPRRYWGMFKTRSKAPSTLMSTPRSDRKFHNAGNHHVIQSRNTTLTRADEWLTKMAPHPNEFAHPADKYEEKVQTITFEPEEEAVIVADLLPPNGNRHDYRSTQKPVVADYDNMPERKAGYERGTDRHQGPDENTHYVSYNGPTNYESRQLRHTVATTPYHVKMSTIDDTGPPNGLFIAPPVTTTTPSDEPVITSTYRYADGVNITAESPEFPPEFPPEIPEPIPEAIPGPSGIGRSSPQEVINDDPTQPAVMTFQDSDDEAGMVPNPRIQAEDEVLF